MKILQLTSDWKWTGPAEPMLHAVAGLRARGHEVDVAFPATPAGHAGGLSERARERGVTPLFEPAAGQGYWPWRDGDEVRRLRALLAGRRYDVVHATHARAHLLTRFALGGRREGTKLVAGWAHGEPIPRRPWNRWLYGPAGCDGVALLSGRLAEDARRLGSPCVGVISGVVDTARFAPRQRRTDLRESLGLKPEQRVIGLVARLQPHRRVDLILAALARARAEAPDLKLVVVGRGTRAREVLDVPVQRLGLDTAVARAGYLRGDDYLDVLAQMDALVYLVPGSDGSCRAALEAMSLGIPAIASRRGALPDLLGDTALYAGERVDELAAAFASVARDPSPWRARGEAARQRALNEFAIDRYAARCESLYEALRARAT
ncbi:MAG TPA: glycosyltransferase family 4 protein [Myxococcota bacterium]|nr:glycosyltransferase family 4 protein [Myxococcota bacterium]